MMVLTKHLSLSNESAKSHKEQTRFINKISNFTEEKINIIAQISINLKNERFICS